MNNKNLNMKNKENRIKRALVVSGGGAKGAWAGGFLQYKVEEQDYDWDMYFGTSTGSMAITMTALHEMERLKEAYTNLDNNAIWSVNPFNKKGNISIFNAAKRLLRKKDSLGETGNLYKRLKSYFSELEFEVLRTAGKKMFACATNYSTGKAVYGSNMELDYEEYIKYTWASTSVPIGCDLVKINGEYYLDGGVLQHVPLQKAINEGADEIDVIVLRANEDMPAWSPDKGMIGVASRSLEIMERSISDYNISLPLLDATIKDVKIRIRYTPYNLTPNVVDAMKFDRGQMLKWWHEGYEYSKQNNTSIKVKINKSSSNLRNYEYL